MCWTRIAVSCSGTTPVPVEPQVFDLLLYLIRNRERVVSKDDLLAAVWRGRIVSESALSTRINAARAALGDNGEAQRLIKTLPRKGLRFVGTVLEDHRVLEAGSIKPPPKASDKPSIAVLPFANLSGDPDQDYFADGIVEDITTALSRNRAFFVIARNSSFTYKSQALDIKQVARELGVRYVLEGSVRKSGGRVRVTGQLIEGASGHHLWADRFDGGLADIFELQDQIVTRVVGAIAPQLEKAEIERARPPHDRRISPPTICTCTASTSWNRWTQEGNAKALQLFYAAIEKDRDFSTAYGLAASCHLLAKANGWAAAFDTTEIARLVERAADIGVRRPGRALLGGTCARLSLQGRRACVAPCRPGAGIGCKPGDRLATQRLGSRLCRRFRRRDRQPEPGDARSIRWIRACS